MNIKNFKFARKKTIENNENTEDKDFKFLKKHYGDRFAKLCRSLFPTILQQKDKLTEIISNNFDNVSTLYDDLDPVKEDFRDFVYSFFDVKQKPLTKTRKTPEKLMEDAGYVLFECETNDDILKFKKYYAPDEELCTFNERRLKTCRVWFAIKKEVLENIDSIERENPPDRQDSYGTSVISIQFTKGEHSYLSIKNRYNHSVSNPDCTFNNNLDNIISGLTYAFCKYKKIKLATNKNTNNLKNYLYDKGYRRCKTNKYYKTSIKISDGYACLNNYILKNNDTTLYFDKSKYILVENYLIDQERKQIINLSTIDNLSNEKVDDIFSKLEDYQASGLSKELINSSDGIHNFNIIDSFIKSIGYIKTVNISHDENKTKVVCITPKEGSLVKIYVDNSGHIIKYENPNTTKIDDDFLLCNSYLQEISLPCATSIGNGFMQNNDSLLKFDFPNVQEIGNDFAYMNKKISSINLPNLKKVGNNFCCLNSNIKNVELPNVEYIGNGFLSSSIHLTSLNLPCAKEIGYSFLRFNKDLSSINLPNVQKIDNNFLLHNEELISLDLPNVKYIGDSALYENEKLLSLYFPKIKYIGTNFLFLNDNRDLLIENAKNIDYNILF